MGASYLSKKFKVFSTVTLLLLVSFLAVFFLCDSFKDTGHTTNHQHEQGTKHHQSLTIAPPQTPIDGAIISQISELSNVVALFQKTLVASPLLLLCSAFLLLLLLYGKLRNYLYQLLSRGILNPKLF